MKSFFLSFDVEEWWAVHSFEKHLKNHAIKMDDRIDVGLNLVLKILDKHNTKATFFVLGRIAKKHPQIIELIASKGHDVGSHGQEHNLVYNQTALEFEKDLQKSIKLIKSITGKDVDKFRAPSYSINESSIWAINVLVNNGIKIDSSIISGKNKRFGIKNAPIDPYFIKTGDNLHEVLLEIPPSTFRFFWKRLPLSSGFFFRANPVWLIRSVFNARKWKSAASVIILHNWEFDVEQPILDAGFFNKLIHYYKLASTHEKLEMLINNDNGFRFEPIKLICDVPVIKLEELISKV